MRQDAGEASVSGAKPLASTFIVLGLGANAWIANIGWLRVAVPGGAHLAWALAPILVLLGGVACLVVARNDAAKAAARWSLLCVYPAALVAVVASYPEAVLEHAHSPLSLTLGALALLAYAAGAAQSQSPSLTNFSTSMQALDRDIPYVPRSRRGRDWARILVAVTWTLAALAITLIAPLSPAFSEVEHAWGDAAAASAVLTALVAGALAVSSVGLFLGSTLRLADAEPPLRAAEARTRIATLLFLALLGSVVYFTVIK